MSTIYDRRTGRALTPAVLVPKRSDVPAGLGFGERIIARCPLCGVEGELRYEVFDPKTGRKGWRVLGCCQHYSRVDRWEDGRLVVEWDFSQEVQP